MAFYFEHLQNVTISIYGFVSIKNLPSTPIQDVSMTARRTALPLIFCIFFLSCNDSDEDLPNIPLAKLSETNLADFNFNENVEYLEKRRYFHGELSDNFHINNEFDPGIKAELSDVQLANLHQSTSTSGIGNGCQPVSCTYYFVTLEQNIATVIDNKLDLHSLIGDVDTPAELHLILQGSKYHPLYYQYSENGFMVLSSWSDCNGASGETLLEVDIAGNVVVIKEISSKQENLVC